MTARKATARKATARASSQLKGTMAGAALKFEAGRTQIHQVLAVRSDGGRSGMPPAPTGRGPAGSTGIVDPACPAGVKHLVELSKIRWTV